MDHVLPRPLISAVTAWLVVTAIIVGRWADVVVPTEYLVRPLLTGSAVAAIVGLLSLPARRWGPALAAGLAFAVMSPSPILLLLMLAAGIAVALLSRHGLWPSSSAVTVAAAIFLSISVVRAAPLLDFRADPVVGASGSPMYVVMLDAYPRADTLKRYGYDLDPFIEALEERGFDHYPDAHSLHRWTDRTLTALLYGPEGVPDEYSLGRDRRQVHERLIVPEGFVAIAPPVGFAVMQGPTLDVQSTNDFEGVLLGESLVGVVLPDLGRSLLAESLDSRIADSLDALATTQQPRVFAHLMAPHAPFPGGPECWPECHMFVSLQDQLGLSTETWWHKMGERLDSLNPMLLDTIDRIIAREPEAVLLLFSDHGSRFSNDDPDEWHRTLLVARTPGHPRLFETPRADTILRTLIEAYP